MNRYLYLPAAILLVTAGILLPGCSGAQDTASDTPVIKAGSRTVKPDDITEFYWTTASSTFPPNYQRYRFYIEDGVKYFFHETREGTQFPLQEEDITASGTKTLSDEEWDTFCRLLGGGTVKAREEDLSAGDSGPWLYLYWKNDNGTIQEYSFPDYAAQKTFESFCISLKES